MVVDDFHFRRMTFRPPENQAPLLIDPHAPETGKIAGKLFQAVARRDFHVPDFFRLVQLAKPHECPGLDVAWQFAGSPAFPDLGRFLACETLNHSPNVTVSGNGRKWEKSVFFAPPSAWGAALQFSAAKKGLRPLNPGKLR